MIQRVLLLYITHNSGHYHASLAVERALRICQPDVDVLNLDAFTYTNPFLKRVVDRTYYGMIKRRPEVWEYLYDNPQVVRRTQSVKRMIHRYNSPKLRGLLESFRPDVVACTQAFPCGMVADLKEQLGLSTPLVAILTDYAPHSYWLYDAVDHYVVAAEETRDRLVRNGVPPDQIKVFGIPIRPAFQRNGNPSVTRESLRLDPELPVILVMGGSGGLGPMRELVWALDRSEASAQLLVVTGTNVGLERWLRRKQRAFRKSVRIFSYVEHVHQLMDCASLIVTKPGGLTTAEALAKSLPMVVLNPIPGQEAKNAQFLLDHQVAVRANTVGDALSLIEHLLQHPAKLEQMRYLAGRLGRPDSAVETARLLLNAA